MVKKIKIGSINSFFMRITLILPLFLVIFIFELFPLVNLLISSFLQDQNMSRILTLENYVKVFISTNSIKAFKNSIVITVISTSIGIIIAYIFIRIIRKTSRKVRKVFTIVLSMISNFSGISLVFSFIILFGNAGLIKKIIDLIPEYSYRFNLYSGQGLLLLYIFFQIPMATLLLMPAFDKVSIEFEESSRILGAMEMFFWIRVGIPIIMPNILNVIVILFANAICAYETAYVLLMNNYPLVSLNISAAYTGDMISKPGIGAAMSIILMLIVCLINMVSRLIIKKWFN